MYTAKLLHSECIIDSQYLADPFSKIKNGWNELLSRYAWQWFCTFTFNPEICHNTHPEKCDKLFKLWINKLMIDQFGYHWFKNKSQDGIYWARGLEYHKSGLIHYHAIIKFPHNMQEPSRYKAELLWEEIAGFSKVEKIKLHGATINYIIKYAVKFGDLDLSDSMVNCPQIPTTTKEDGL